MDTVFQTLAPSSLPVLHGFLPGVAGGTTRPTKGSYPLRSHHHQAPHCPKTAGFHPGLGPIMELYSRSRALREHSTISLTKGEAALVAFSPSGFSSIDRPGFHHPLMRFGPAAGFFCGRRWTSGEGCPPLLKFLPSDVCFR